MMNKKSLELYIHIPFCARKCAYCDFLSFPGNVQMQREYMEQLGKEIRLQGVSCSDYKVVSIFIGGGTPSILNASDLLELMKTLKESFTIVPEAEITMEANPGTVKLDSLKDYRSAGINRISLGLQSADDTELRYLGRIHTFDEFLKTYQRVRMAGFTNINVDLISAIPGQTLDSWKNTLKKVTRLKPEHISAYSLIVEEGTPYFDRYGTHVELSDDQLTSDQRKRLMALPALPDEDTEREMYYMTQTFLAEQGYERYEISNYSRPGFECAHNIGYWTGTEYLGLGLGASSYINGSRFHNTPDFKEYTLANLDQEEDFRKCLRQEFESLTKEARMEEYMFLGLRLMRGVSALGFITRFGQSIRSVYGNILDQLSENGLLEYVSGYYRLTGRGIDLSNYVMSEFLLD